MKETKPTTEDYMKMSEQRKEYQALRYSPETMADDARSLTGLKVDECYCVDKCEGTCEDNICPKCEDVLHTLPFGGQGCTTQGCPNNEATKLAIEHDYEAFRQSQSEDWLKLEEAKKRKRQPVFSGVLKYFPNALKAVSNASLIGSEQHNGDAPLWWDMTKSKDEGDCLVRHLIDHTINPIDTDGVPHLAKVAWRALAMLERDITNNK